MEGKGDYDYLNLIDGHNSKLVTASLLVFFSPLNQAFSLQLVACYLKQPKHKSEKQNIHPRELSISFP